jgi:hypothetical protein
MNRLAIGQENSGENKMKINLKFGTKKEPVQTGLQVHTHMRAGSFSKTLGTLYEIGGRIIPRAEIIPPFDSLPIYTEDKP